MRTFLQYYNSEISKQFFVESVQSILNAFGDLNFLSIPTQNGTTHIIDYTRIIVLIDHTFR